MNKNNPESKSADKRPVDIEDRDLDAIGGGVQQKTVEDRDPEAAICNGVSVLAYARVDGES